MRENSLKKNKTLEMHSNINKFSGGKSPGIQNKKTSSGSHNNSIQKNITTD